MRGGEIYVAKKKRNMGAAVAIGSGVGAVAGAALGAAAVAMADKSVREKTFKTAKRVGSQATKTLAQAGKKLPKNVPMYGERSYGAAGGSTGRKPASKKSSTKPKK